MHGEGWSGALCPTSPALLPVMSWMGITGQDLNVWDTMSPVQ